MAILASIFSHIDNINILKTINNDHDQRHIPYHHYRYDIICRLAFDDRLGSSLPRFSSSKFPSIGLAQLGTPRFWKEVGWVGYVLLVNQKYGLDRFWKSGGAFIMFNKTGHFSPRAEIDCI